MCGGPNLARKLCSNKNYKLDLFCPTDTVAEEKVFKALLGPFASDVMLVNITFSTEVLSVADCNIRGFNVQEHQSKNGSKAFTLEVPFTDPVVLLTVCFTLGLGNIPIFIVCAISLEFLIL